MFTVFTLNKLCMINVKDGGTELPCEIFFGKEKLLRISTLQVENTSDGIVTYLHPPSGISHNIQMYLSFPKPLCIHQSNFGINAHIIIHKEFIVDCPKKRWWDDKKTCWRDNNLRQLHSHHILCQYNTHCLFKISDIFTVIFNTAFHRTIINVS